MCSNIRTCAPFLELCVHGGDDSLEARAALLLLLVSPLPLLRGQLLVHRHRVLNRLRSASNNTAINYSTVRFMALFSIYSHLHVKLRFKYPDAEYSKNEHLISKSIYFRMND